MEVTRDDDAARAAHEARRARIVGAIPAGYRPRVHFAIPAAVGLLVLGGSLARLDFGGMRPIELLTVPITLFASLGFEWRAHKDMLHRRLPLFGVLYERHERKHHVIFTDRDMALRGRREMGLVLMPPYAIVLVFLALVLPFAVGVERFLGTNPAMLMTATSMLFFLSYEWLHLAYHLPLDHPVAKNALVARLREHHRRHHEPRLMKRWNFNVTLPLFDWLHGTNWSTASRSIKGPGHCPGPGRGADSPSSGPG